MTEVINDALGLTQYLTKHLEENQAVSYLLAIQGLDIEAWRSAKELLPGVVNTNRQWKEGHIKDCVNVFCNTEVKTTFLVRNLSLIPGFDRTNLHLATFIAAAAQGVKTISSRMIEHQSAVSISQSTVEDLSQQTAQTHSPAVNGRGSITSQLSHPSPSHHVNQNNALAPSSAWANGNSEAVDGAPKNKNIQYRKPSRTWLHGTDQNRRSDRQPALKFTCLAVKSGSDETVESLQAAISKANYRNLEVEAVSQSSHSTVFRVKFHVPLALQDNWKEPASWPSGASVSLWKGNPRSPLKQLKERIYRKCIYIGNLSPSGLY